MKSDNPFDIMAISYANKSSTSIYNAYYERPALISLLPNIKGKQVLDAGCGSGTLTQELLDRGATVTGVDLSSGLLEIAKEKFGDKVQFYHADLSEPLDYLENNYYDLVVSSLALHYIEDWNVLFRNFAKVLKIGSKIIFSTHHPSASRRWFDLGDYFSRKLVSDVWRVDDKDIIIKNYHRSLTEMFRAFSRNNFITEELLEPQPMEEARDLSPLSFHRLNTTEHFILFQLRFEG